MLLVSVYVCTLCLSDVECYTRVPTIILITLINISVAFLIMLINSFVIPTAKQIFEPNHETLVRVLSILC